MNSVKAVCGSPMPRIVQETTSSKGEKEVRIDVLMKRIKGSEVEGGKERVRMIDQSTPA